MTPGKGIGAKINGKKILCGNSIYMTENGVVLNNNINDLEELQKQGKATVIIAYDGECAGAIGLSDTVRSTAKNMVHELKQTQVDTVLLTGHNKQTADYFAEQAGDKHCVF